MQDTTVALTKDASLQKELLSKAHVAVSEDERKAVAFYFVVEFRSIGCSYEWHDPLPIDVYLLSLC